MYMNNRLKFIFERIPKGKGIVDVGTDHGHLAIQLALSDYNGDIFATDIRKAPLNSAIHSAERLGVKDKIKFILCDGLQGIKPDSIDTIVCAGLGAETITGILDRDYWCAAPGYNLFLQPMTMEHVLRYWLINNEFIIKNEYLIEDGNFLYTVIQATYGKSRLLNDAELFVGDKELLVKNPLFYRKIDIAINKLLIKINGLKHADCKCNAVTIHFLENIYQELLDMKGRQG